MGNDDGSTPATEAELRLRLVELEKAIQARDDLLAVAAHELRNPMHALLLQVSAALAVARRDGNVDLARRIERVKHITDRYVKRATVLLDVCRVNARKFPLRVETVDLVEVVREAAESYAPEAEFHHSAIHVSSPEHLEGHWDRLATEQIVSNLISNAIKYGAGAPVHVDLREEGGGFVTLAVRDAGIGIAPEDQERIFGRFEQGATPAGRNAGFGVGLWLVRSLVEVHGGEISVSSVPERGSTFTVRLPRDARQFQEEPSSA
jgi:two-component system, OmpR family, sensor kinase